MAQQKLRIKKLRICCYIKRATETNGCLLFKWNKSLFSQFSLLCLLNAFIANFKNRQMLA